MTEKTGSRSISIAMTTYNGERFLTEQLDSLARQVRLPDELVICDDGSTDDTRRIIEKFARSAPFPVVLKINTRRLGHADNFLQAIAMCKSEFVACCDQDDVWSVNKLAISFDRMAAEGSLISLHKSQITDEALRPIGILSQGIAGDAVFEPLMVFPYQGLGWGHTLMFKRAIATLIPTCDRPTGTGSTDKIGHDIWMYLLAAGLGRVSHIDALLVQYRQHGRNTTPQGRVTLSGKIKAVMTAFVDRQNDRVRLYYDIAECFAGIADRNEPFCLEARAASASYCKMADRARDRVDIYLQTKLGDRLHKYLMFHKKYQEVNSSSVKDLLLGVFQLGWTSR